MKYLYIINYKKLSCRILDAGAPSVMALLWSVTDRDIDRYTLRLYADWFSAKSTAKNEPGPNLAAFISSSEIGIYIDN